MAADNPGAAGWPGGEAPVVAPFPSGKSARAEVGEALSEAGSSQPGSDTAASAGAVPSEDFVDQVQPTDFGNRDLPPLTAFPEVDEGPAAGPEVPATHAPAAQGDARAPHVQADTASQADTAGAQSSENATASASAAYAAANVEPLSLARGSGTRGGDGASVGSGGEGGPVPSATIEPLGFDRPNSPEIGSDGSDHSAHGHGRDEPPQAGPIDLAEPVELGPPAIAPERDGPQADGTQKSSDRDAEPIELGGPLTLPEPVATGETPAGAAPSDLKPASSAAATATTSASGEKPAVGEASAAIPPGSGDKASEQAAARTAAPTLEETVAGLLRPMLRQWLDENLPRIIEKTVSETLAHSNPAPDQAAKASPAPGPTPGSESGNGEPSGKG